MRSKMTWAAFSAVVAIGLLPFKAGCGSRTACIPVAPDVYAKTGQCPSVEKASEFFFGGNCFGSKVQSVDGEGTYDGQHCCYPVTNNDSEFGGVPEFCGFGGAGGGAGAGGFGGGCTTCEDFVTTPGISPNALCNGFDSTFLDLRDCACQVCSTCKLNFCQDAAPTIECLDCLADGCVSEVSACKSSF
jgi:hypothetical protein